MNFFKNYGNTSEYPFTIDKDLIEKFLTVLSIELYNPSKFEFNNEIVTFTEVLSSLKQTFCKLHCFIYLFNNLYLLNF